jgi:hypothetical protein
VIRFVLTSVLAVSALAAGQRSQTFTGTITDSMCADANHGRMRMGPTDAECVQACVESHDAPYVLYDGTTTYELSDQKAPAAFAARKVTVTGTLDSKTKTIHVESIAAAR